MKPALPIAAIAALALGGAASSRAQDPAEPLYVRHAMLEMVNPAITIIWDIGNASLNEDGGIDPSQMDDGKWTALAEAGARLEKSGRAMENAATLKAAAPDNMATSEFEVPMSAVQAKIDADPAGFREEAGAFAKHAAALASAAAARNDIATSELIAQTDAVCASCHARFWYAE